ncbi:hypothetical protein PVL29_012009 [Vitis rotundifolia]|uniref:Uncharacterized protein n=1 Tax=Vitis rotundifolia TaxID=103349 RepID=A0AA39DT02_VITRO|nr:hypothetical protein PVL29_012009 [Vitis rotundifolia]
MVSGRVPERRSYSGEYQGIGERRRIESVRVLENKRKKASYPGDYRGRDTIQASIEEYRTNRESNSCEYRRISDRNDGIRVSTGEEINARQKGCYSGEYMRGDCIRSSTGEYETDEESNLCKYRRVKERKHPIRATAEEEILSGRVSENTRQIGNRICVSTGESKTEMMVSGRVPEKRSYSNEYRRVKDRRGVNPFEYCRIQDIKDGIRAST